MYNKSACSSFWVVPIIFKSQPLETVSKDLINRLEKIYFKSECENTLLFGRFNRQGEFKIFCAGAENAFLKFQVLTPDSFSNESANLACYD